MALILLKSCLICGIIITIQLFAAKVTKGEGTRLSPVTRRIVRWLVSLVATVLIVAELAGLVGQTVELLHGQLVGLRSDSFSTVISHFLISLVAIAICFHLIGYCFSGLLMRIPPAEKLWPKGIDYVYYGFGLCLLVIIIGEIRGELVFSLESRRTQVIVGLLLFNLKILKTSCEVFPNIFICKEGWIRAPFFGRLL